MNIIFRDEALRNNRLVPAKAIHRRKICAEELFYVNFSSHPFICPLTCKKLTPLRKYKIFKFHKE